MEEESSASRSERNQEMNAVRIVHWNVRTGNGDTIRAKKRIITAAAPAVVLLNEIRREVQITGFNSFTSLPAPGLHQKRNA